MSEANEVEKSRPSSEGEGEALTDSSAEGAVGITAITIPASVTTIEEHAFTGADTLQYVIVSEDNPNYSMYDGCLYDKPQTSLLLIPEGRLGAVRIPSTATTIPEDASSHCASLTSFVVGSDSAASQLLAGRDFYNANDEKIEITNSDSTDEPKMVADYSTTIEAQVGDTVDLYERLNITVSQNTAIKTVASDDGSISVDDGVTLIEKGGNTQVALVVSSIGKPTEVIAASLEASSDAWVENEDATTCESLTTLELESIAKANAAENIDGNSYYGKKYKNASLALSPDASNPNYVILYTSTGFDGTITWTGGTADGPAEGSVVTVTATRYVPASSISSVIEGMYSNSLGPWGVASETEKLIGFRATGTGSFLPLESIFDGKGFSFSFTMPASGCTINNSGLNYYPSRTSMAPVTEHVEDMVVTYFAAGGGYFTNPVTGAHTQSSITVATYSKIGSALMLPSSVAARSGYTLTGWADSNGSMPPMTVSAADNGKTYTAQWAANGGSKTYSGKTLMARANVTQKSNYVLLYTSNGFDGTITWTGGTADAPTKGSIVTVTATRYVPSMSVSSVKEGMYANSILQWGIASKDKRLVGFRDENTGSFLSLDSIFDGNGFSFSFKMPASGCIVNDSGLDWYSSTEKTTLTPVTENVENMIVTNYIANPGYFLSPVTGARTQANGNVIVSTYSTIGDALTLPTSATIRDGYTLTKWEDTSGSLPPMKVSAEDNGKTYVAQWGALGGSVTCVNKTLRVQADVSNSNYVLFHALGSGFDGTISWTGGTADSPAPGSIVTVVVTRYVPGGSVSSVKEGLYYNSIFQWGVASKTERLIGFRDKKTGSYFSLDSIFDGGGFSFTFEMPESGCSVGAGGMDWRENRTLVPVTEHVDDMIVTNYIAHPGYFLSPTTGASTQVSNEVLVCTYSKIGDALILPSSVATRSGYTFTGWFTSTTSSTLAPKTATADLQGKTYYAQWGNKDTSYYFFSFNKNDSAAAGEMPNWSVPSTNKFTGPEAEFVKPGYTVTAWTTAANGSGTTYKVGTEYPAMPANSTTALYAKWEKDTYNLSFDLKGGSFGSGYTAPSSYQHENGTINIPNPTRPGYEFTGWTGTGLSAATKNLAIDKHSDDKLGTHAAGTSTYARSYTATWRPYTYKVEFHNGEAGHTDDKVADDQSGFTYGTAKALVLNSLADAKPGYHITGWKIGAADSTERVATATGTLSTFPNHAPSAYDATVKLYCEWTPNNYTVTLHDGASAEAAQTGFIYSTDNEANKDKAIAAASFTKAAYHIAGWAFSQADANARTKAFSGATPVIASATLASSSKIPAQNGNIDLYAVWEPDDYTVTLNTEHITEWDTDVAQGFKGASSWSFAIDQKKAENLYTVESGEDLAIPSAATETGVVILPNPEANFYTFKGWTNVKDGAGNPVTLITYKMAEDDIRYGFKPSASGIHASFSADAVWEEVKYPLAKMMELDDGEVGPVDYVAGRYDIVPDEGAFDWMYTVSGTSDGGALPVLSTKPGYTFTGWSSPDNIICKADGSDFDAADFPVKTGAHLKANKTALAKPQYKLVAHFTRDHHGLTLDLGLSDAKLADSELSDGSSEGWKKAAGEGNAYAYVDTAGHDGWSVDITGGTITLPVPERNGYKFMGWTVKDLAEGATSPLAGDGTESAPYRFALPVKGESQSEAAYHAVLASFLMDYTFEAQWTQCDYTVTLGNILTHVDAADGFATGSFSDDSTQNVKAFDGSALGVSSGVTIGEPTQLKTDHVQAFTRWVTAKNMDGVDGWTKETVNGTDAWVAKSFTITQVNVEDYFGEGSANTSGQTFDFAVEAEFENVAYTATIDFSAGVVKATATQPETTVAGGALSEDDASVWVSNELDYDCSDPDITLPKPTLYGYTFEGWMVKVGDAEYVSMDAVTEGDQAGEFLLLHDSVGTRVYKPVWAKRTAKVQLHDNAASVGMTATPTAPAAPIDVVFGEPMPSVSVWPAVDGYDFIGYFDTPEASGGKQYYLADHASANLWDKAPKEDGTAYDLYGRWTKRDVAGETPVPAKSANITLFAKNPKNVDGVAFKATYNGRYTTSDTGHVTVSVDSYTFVDCDADSIYQEFQKAEGEADRFLLGFQITSTGSFIPFSRFVGGEQFEFEVLASEIVAGTEAPNVALGAGSVVAVYTADEIPTKPGEGGDPVDPTPSEGQTVTTIWDANGGAFDSNGTASKTSGTAFKAAPAKTYVDFTKVSEPARTGYEFIGWSKSKTHATDDDCAKNGEIPLFELTSVVPVTYHAHWKAKASTIAFDPAGGTPSTVVSVSGFPFDQSGTQLGATVDDITLPSAPTRTGYDFLGYFDAVEGGTQYFSSAGAQVKAWDKEPAADDRAHTLYAHWASKSGTGTEPSDPEDPNPDDPFPGIPTTPGTVETVVTKAPHDKLSVAAAIATDVAGTWGNVITGTYDGTVTFRTSNTSVPEGYLPTGDDDVLIRLFTYSFDTQAVVNHFDSVAPANGDGTKQYLQGFEVSSTGSRIPLAALANGKTVEIVAKGSDVAGIEGETLASFAIPRTKMVPVYGATPAIPLQAGGSQWPVEVDPNRTQVENVFDASVGRFGEGSSVRFESATSPYLNKLVLPDDEPAYNTAEGYHFDGWFTADGTEVTKRDSAGQLVYEGGKLVAADDAYASSPTPVTYYAHYKQTNFNFTFVDGATSEYTAEEYPILNVPEPLEAYTGQLLSTVKFPTVGTDADAFRRKGFEFLGWYAADGTPYYLAANVLGEDRDKYNAFLAGGPTMTQAVELTARWQPITYTVNFRWDSGQKYQHAADNVTRTVKYGEKVAEGFIPLPQDPGYTFKGWYQSTKFTTSSQVYDAATKKLGKNYFTDDGRFKPAADAIPNPMEVFARFATNISPENFFKIELEAGDHGTVTTSEFTYNYASPDFMMTTLRDQVHPDAGWEFDCLKEVLPGEDGEAEKLVKVDFDRIPSGSTGNRTFRAFYVAKSDYKIDLNWGDKPEGVSLNADDEELWGEDMTLPVTVEMTDPIALPTDFEVEGHLGYEFLGWFKVNDKGELLDTEKTEAVTPSALIGDPANESVTVFRYMAQWQPKAYEITFRYGETPSDEDFTVDVASYEDAVKMPVPATVGNGKIFLHWGAWPADGFQSGAWDTWTSYDEPVPFKTIVSEALMYQSSAPADLEQGRVTVYANWGQRVGATLPLQVNLLIDPYLPEVTMAEAYVGTYSEDPVQVESLTYQMAEDEGDVPGTESIFTDGSGVRTDDFALTVTAGDGSADTLSIPLDEPGVVSRDLSDYGFVPFAKDSALPVKYGLTLPKLGDGTLADLRNFSVLMDPDKLLDKMDGNERVAFPIAKLYYTIGLVPRP